LDSLTHIVLGACIGEALAGQKIGKKALLIGAAAQSLPDIDFITFLWMSPAEQLLAHRGFTHSFLFICLISPLLGIVFQKLLKNKVTVQQISLFFFLELLVHVFLDAFNNYGVGWFEPFSDVRVSFNTIYVADIMMTIVPTIAFIVLLILPSGRQNRRKWSIAGIVWCTLYLSVTVFNKIYIDRQVNVAFARQKISTAKYFTTPAPLQSLLWMIVSKSNHGFYVGYRSVFDSDTLIRLQYFASNEHLLDSIEDHKDVHLLKKFSQNYYTIEKWNDTLVFNDLRFGQIAGWQNAKEKFVFHYFLQHPSENRLVIQRGRFSKWDFESIRSYINRIKGI
jgi:inner membrane protein